MPYVGSTCSRCHTDNHQTESAETESIDSTAAKSKHELQPEEATVPVGQGA